MNENPGQDHDEEPCAASARRAAEEVLRTIYGDDFRGCTISLEEIAQVISQCMASGEAATRDREFIKLYEQLVEALHLLATPPEHAKELGPDELRSLLGDRLDKIHALTSRTRATTGGLRRNAN
jgi:hypothetical protein